MFNRFQSPSLAKYFIFNLGSSAAENMDTHSPELPDDHRAGSQMGAINLHISHSSHHNSVLVRGLDSDLAWRMDRQADPEVEDLGQVELGQFLYNLKMNAK